MTKVKIIGNALILAGILLMIVAVIMNNNATPVLGIAGMVVSCSGFIYFTIFWKCPFCETSLPINGMIGMEYCPYCGGKLDS